MRRFGFLFFCLLLAVCVLVFWSQLKREFAVSQGYHLDPDRIHLSSFPEWLPDSFVSDVLKKADLTQSETVLDKKTPGKIYSAFAASPWVEQVDNVRIQYPAEIYVDLTFRIPCCLIEAANGTGYFLVDEKGTLLPSDHTSDIFLNESIIVTGIDTVPIGSVGDSWGDEAVTSAAKLARFLWSEAKVTPFHINVIVQKIPDGFTFEETPFQPPRYQIIFADGEVYDWNEIDASRFPTLKDEEKKKTLITDVFEKDQ
ncbi:MAG: hypothetical protein ACRC2T_09360 [Thermoguttaceae bacterium]